MENNAQTSVAEVDIDINDLLELPGTGADNIVSPAETTKNTNMFQAVNKPESTAFLDEEDEVPKDPKEGEKADGDAGDQGDIDTIVDEVENTDDKNKGGRPKADKAGVAATFKKLIEKGKLLPFEDDKPLEEYTANDWEELLEMNIAESKREVQEQTPKEFFEALPEELQFAAKYALDGGKDMRGLFAALAQVEQVRALDAEVPEDQEQIIRSYLSTTEFGTSDEIADEIDTYKKAGLLEKKAGQLKPKLDKMQKEQVAFQVQQQEKIKEQQQAAAKRYVDQVYTTMQKGELAGVKIDKRTQHALYNGLVTAQFPSMSGRPTNLLGHLLEKYQYQEPNYDLIAEATWLLNDPEGYRAAIAQPKVNNENEKNLRTIKTEAGRKLKNSSEETEKKEEPTRRTIKRNPSTNFFAR